MVQDPASPRAQAQTIMARGPSFTGGTPPLALLLGTVAWYSVLSTILQGHQGTLYVLCSLVGGDATAGLFALCTAPTVQLPTPDPPLSRRSLCNLDEQQQALIGTQEPPQSNAIYP